MQSRKIFIWMIVLGLFLSACSSRSSDQSGIKVRDAWVRAVSSTGDENSAGYLTILNHNTTADRLLRAEGNFSKAVEIHQTEMKDGVMSMHPVDFIEIPAGGQVELQPGGTHIMLIGVNSDLLAGDKVRLVLVFETAGEIAVDAEVRTP